MTSYMRHTTLDLPAGVGIRVWSPRVTPELEYHFDLGATAGIIDQTGHGHVLTPIGAPSWNANGIQFGNGQAGFETDMDEVASLTRVVIAAVPAVTPVSQQARFMGTFQGGATARMGSSIGLLEADVSTAYPNGQEGYAGYVALTSNSLANFGTVNYGPVARRLQLRIMALSIDAVNGKIIKYMPKYDGAVPVEIAVPGLANRPLNGRDRIGAWKSPGDAAGFGAYTIKYAARWNRALDAAELKAEAQYLRNLYGDV